MLSNDATIQNIKHEILYEVAKLAYAGRFEEEKDELAYKMFPGPKARFRCCVYKEREIARQRIRLAEGKCPTESDHPGANNIIQVIEAACADCPLSHYIVTDNCRKCMMKACQQACKFGAVSMTRDRAYIDPDKCKECGMCAKACPFGAIGSKTDIVDVIKAIVDGKKVVAMVAPAVEGQFGDTITMSSIRTACKKLGFNDMYEVGLGGDLTAQAEAEEWLEAAKEGKKLTTSCCPAFVNLIKKQYPELAEHISTTISPMFALSRLLKSEDPDTITVFIGPCIAKKNEKQEYKGQGNADFVLTLGEFRAMMRAKEVVLEPEENSDQQASIYGKRFGNGGGVSAAVAQCMREAGADPDKFNIEKCSGAAECKKALTLLKVGKLPADFIEGMVCEGGCVGGPSRHRSGKNPVLAAKDRDKLLAEADDRNVSDNLSKYDLTAFSMHK